MNLKVNLGKTIDGQDFFVDFEKQKIHLTLLVGATGTGKSVLGYSIYRQLVQQNSFDDIGFVLIDNIQIEFTHWNRGSPYLYFPVSWSKQAFNILEGLESKIDEINHGQKHLFVHIEEMDLFAMDYKRIEKVLKQLLEQKENSKIHIIFSTSRPQPDIFVDWLLALTDLKIICQMASSDDYITVTGKDYTKDFAKYLGEEKFVIFKDEATHLLPLTTEEKNVAEAFKL